MSRFSQITAIFLSTAAVAVSAAMAPSVAHAQAATKPAPLSIGSPAPKLPVAEWVKGKPVSLADGKVHVVEFWATWCGPCKTTIPHLTDMAKKYAGKADFTGVSVWERGDNVATKVKSFVTEMGAKMDYHIARDDAQGTIAKTWMEAAGQDGIPTAFVVDKTGKVVWIGHPMNGLDEVVGAVVAGTYDVSAAQKKFKEQQAAAAKEEEKGAEMQALFAPALKLARERKFAEAIASLDKTIEANPQYASDIAPLKLSLLMMSDEAAGQAYAVKLSQTDLKNNAGTLNSIAWNIVGPDSKMKQPDYAAGLAIAQAAVAASGEKEAAILDTLSWAYEKTGDLDNAIATEEKAVALYPADSKDADLVDMKTRIADLKAKKAAKK